MDIKINSRDNLQLLKACIEMKLGAFYDRFQRAQFEPEDLLSVQEQTLVQIGIRDETDRFLILNRIKRYKSSQRTSSLFEWIALGIHVCLFILPTILYVDGGYGWLRGPDVIRNFGDIWRSATQLPDNWILFIPLLSGLIVISGIFCQLTKVPFEETNLNDITLGTIWSVIFAGLYLIWAIGNAIIIYHVFILSNGSFEIDSAYYLNIYFILMVAGSLIAQGITELLEKKEDHLIVIENEDGSKTIRIK